MLTKGWYEGNEAQEISKKTSDIINIALYIEEVNLFVDCLNIISFIFQKGINKLLFILNATR